MIINRINKIVFLVLLCISCFSCHQEDTIDIKTDGTDFLSFSINGSGEVYKSFLIKDSIIHVKVPYGKDLTSLVPNFTINGEKVQMDSSEVISGQSSLNFSDFTNPVKFIVVSSDGETKKWSVILYDLPVLVINTPDGEAITSTKVRTEGCEIILVDSDGNKVDLGKAGIKGRGSSSWQQPKKPYNIKLDEKHSILGMKKSKHWILLANAYYDRTQLHNATGFEMARLTDYPWVQSGTFVELIFNGFHQGLYYLCEKIRIEKGRIDITEILPTDSTDDNLTGGYLIESAVAEGLADESFVTDYFNKTGRRFAYDLGWNCKNPDKEEIPYLQLNYLRESMNHMEMLIMNEDSLKTGKYRDYFNIDSAINWWIVEEAALNEEATRTKNVYLYKDRGGQFVIGPPWDFDAWTFGYYGTNHYYCTKTSLYYEYLFKDPFFVNRLKEKWDSYKPVWLDRIPKFIDSQFNKIHRSALRNEKMWPDFCPEAKADEMTWEQSIQEMKNAFLSQMEWMDNSIKNNYFVDWWDENDWPPAQR